MPINPRTPVLVGSGQVNYREAVGPEDTPEPVDLMAMAAREAADARVLEAVDSIRVVNLLSVHYRDPALLLGQRIGERADLLLQREVRDESGDAEFAGPLVDLAGGGHDRDLGTEPGEPTGGCVADAIGAAGTRDQRYPAVQPIRRRIESGYGNRRGLRHRRDRRHRGVYAVD